MTPTDFIGIAISALLIAGFGWALLDLGSRIVKQPKRPFNMLKLSSYPLVPDKAGKDRPRHERRDGLQLQPVPVKIERS